MPKFKLVVCVLSNDKKAGEEYMKASDMLLFTYWGKMPKRTQCRIIFFLQHQTRTLSWRRTADLNLITTAYWTRATDGDRGPFRRLPKIRVGSLVRRARRGRKAELGSGKILRQRISPISIRIANRCREICFMADAECGGKGCREGCTIVDEANRAQ
jgi:hypothetical protein